MTVAVRQVICSSSFLYTSAVTTYFPCARSQQRRANIKDAMCPYRRDLLGQFDLLNDGKLSLLDRALEIDILDLLAEVERLVDELDKAVFDHQLYVRALRNCLLDCSSSFDGQVRAAYLEVSLGSPS